MKNKHIFFSLTAIFIILVALAYSNHFHNSFHFDDSHTIQNNMSIRNINIGKFFSDVSAFSSLPANQSYRPIFTTLIAFEYWLLDGNPFGFHIVAFLIYLILWVLLFFFVRKIFSLAQLGFDNNIVALIVSSFYIIHGANAETVNYLSAQSDLLSTTLMLASLVLYALQPKWRRFGLYLIPAALAIFTKEVSAVFGLFMLAYIFYERSFSKDPKLKSSSQCISAALPSFLVCLFLLAFSSSMVPNSFTPSNLARSHYMMAQPFVVFHYFTSFFLPFNLSADTDWESITNLFDTRLLAGLAFIILMIFLAIKTWRNNQTRPISFGIWWFFIGVFPPSSGVVVLAEVMNDHRMFLPFIGLAIAVSASLLLKFSWKVSNTKKALSVMMIGLVFCGHAFGTFQRNKIWKDEEALWYDVTLKSPRNGRGLMNYGLTLMAKGQIKEALAYFDRARVYTPNYAYLHINTGIALDALGDSTKAEGYFKQAIEANNNYFGGYYYYARFLNKHQRQEEAIPLLTKSLKLAPAYAESRYLLMRILAKKQDWNALGDIAEETLKLWPNNDLAISFKKIAATAQLK